MTNVSHTLGRQWDEFDAYLFDIDGTLIQCLDAVHYFAFCHVLKQLSGQDLTLEGVVAHGNVDGGILRDALVRAGVPDADWRPRLPEARAAMGDFVHRHQAELSIETMPEVHTVLQHLQAKAATLGVATGNLARIGELKLRHAGLWRYFDFGGWSDGYEYREDVFRAALLEAKRLRGAKCTVCVVGDTPVDIRAAHENGLPVIAVATGIYSREELSKSGPDLLLQSFADLFVQNSPA